jgi:hypothetical protein
MRLHVWDDGRWMAEDDDGVKLADGWWTTSTRLVIEAHAYVDDVTDPRVEPAKRRRCKELLCRSVVAMVSAAGAIA